jgi:pyrimidine operon attenuation protein/uracil phosphoribosyltransferase
MTTPRTRHYFVPYTPNKTRTSVQESSPSVQKIKILSSAELQRTFMRLAHQFMEPFDDPSRLGIIGMQTRGVFLAKRIQMYIKEFYGVDVPMGVLDVTFYRDDFRTKMKIPSVKVTEIPFDTFGRDVILVDDVLYTGRTLRSALDAVMDFGRPSSVKFCSLVDRGHRELPVKCDFTGLELPTYKNEEVRVYVEEIDGEDAVYLLQFEGEPPPKSQG